MWENDKNWLIVVVLTIISSTTMQAQWREVRFAPNHIVSQIVATDDGRGIVFLTDTNVRVVTTHDFFRTFDTIPLPKPEAPYVFEPYSYDTTANGTVVVVGQHRPPLDTVVPGYLYLRHSNTTTAAYYSSDWGKTWTEVLPRLPGRFMSISFRGRPEGLLLYELDWKDSLEHTDAAPMYEYYGRDLITVDQRMQAISKIVVDTVSVRSGRSRGRSKCIEGNPQKRSYVDRINDSVLVMETLHPCKNDQGIEDDPSGFNRTPGYILEISTDNGRTWDFKRRRANFNYGNNSGFRTMKIFDDTTWVDNQGFVYNARSIEHSKYVCSTIPRGTNLIEFWSISDALDQHFLLLQPLDSLFPDDTIRVNHVPFIVSLVDSRTCTVASNDTIGISYNLTSGYKLSGFPQLKPLFNRNQQSVIGLAYEESSQTVRNLRNWHWRIFVRDTKTTSSSDGIESNASLLQEHNGIIFLPSPLNEQSQAEYYSLIGSLRALVPIQAGASQTTVPQLPVGVYIVRIPNVAPLKILVR